MINKKFIDDWSSKYDAKYKESHRLLEQKIRDKLKRMFPKGKVKYVTKEILYDIICWKAPRAKSHAKKNEEGFVREVAKHCFSSNNEQFKVEGLTILKGVKYRTATTVLNFCFPSKYTVMDYRAWWTLLQSGCLSDKIRDDFKHWQDYLSECRKISRRYGCSLRTLDKALWRYSKENQR